MIVLLILGFLLALLIVFMIIRTLILRASGPDLPPGRPADLPGDLRPGYAQRFSRAIALPTVTPPEGGGFPEMERALLDFQAMVQEQFPHLAALGTFTSLGPFGWYIRIPRDAASGWQAVESPQHRDKDGNRDPAPLPMLLLAHYDVVPVEAEFWDDEPFSGRIAQGFVHGRGTLDTKNTLMAILEAGDYLVSRGTAFDRDVYLAFGGDEERNGTRGARQLAEHFRSRGLRFSLVSDEGLVVAREGIPGVKTPVVLLGTEEKGYTNLELWADQPPGHSSRPPRFQAAARLGRALSRLESHTFPYELSASVRAFFEGLVPLVPFTLGLIFANLRITKPLFVLAMRNNPEAVSMVRTTLAMTVLQGSPAENVLPSRVRAVVNLRLLPGWTPQEALEQVRRRVRGLGVQVDFQPGVLHSSPVTQGQGEAREYERVARAAQAAFPGIPVLPSLVTAQTDSRHYADLTDTVVRFAPMELGKAELNLIHGHNERISLENYEAGIRFYLELLQSAQSHSNPPAGGAAPAAPGADS